MKKKVIAITTILTVGLVACGNDVATETLSASIAETTVLNETEPTTTQLNLEDLGKISVEKELFDVTLNIPSDFIGESTQEELDEKAEKIGYKVTLNNDGSATYVMTKIQHKQLMQEITESINQSLSQMVESEEYPNITKITANHDFTSFTIVTKSEKLDLAEAFSTIGFYMYGGLYHIFNGSSVDNIHVEFVNADSGKIISSSDSKDANNTESTK